MNFSFWPFLWFGLPGRLLIEGFLEEVLLRRVLRRRLVRVSIETEVFRRILRRGCVIEGA